MSTVDEKRKPGRPRKAHRVVSDFLRVRLSDDLKSRFERMADHREETVSTVVRSAMREYAEKHKDEWADSADNGPR